MGSYTGSYSQNIMLLNSIRDNDYYQSGLPGAQSTGTTGGSHVDQISDNSLENVNTRTGDDNYFEDIMSQGEFNQPFDEWTRNFADTYMKPEWEESVYNPTMRQLNKGIGDYNQQAGNSGAWRSTMTQKNLANMAEDAMREDQRMQKEFRENVLDVRDSIRSNLANPLYESNIERWYDAPWGNVDTPEGAENIPGVGGDDLDSLIESINNWTPGENEGEAPLMDWTFPPNSSFYSPDSNIFRQYVGGLSMPNGAANSNPYFTAPY